MAITTMRIAALSLTLLASAPALAATIPERGSTMDSVRAQLGSPNDILPAVGNPPITRWVYPDFTVYFEYNLALDTVMNEQSYTMPTYPAATDTSMTPVTTGTRLESMSSLPQITPVTDDSDTAAASDMTEPAEAEAPSQQPAPPAETKAPSQQPAQPSAPLFNPATGQFMGNTAEGAETGTAASSMSSTDNSQPMAEETTTQATDNSQPVAEETTTQATDKQQASQPAAVGSGFHFDPVTGRIIMDGQPAATANNSDQAATSESAQAETTQGTAVSQTTESDNTAGTSTAMEASSSQATPTEPKDNGTQAAAEQPQEQPSSQQQDAGGHGFSIDWGN